MGVIIRSALTALALLSIVRGEPAQRSTIPEALAAGGRSLFGGSGVPSGPAPSLTEILAETDLVVRGVIGTGRSYFSEDEMDVLTDLPIERPVVVYDRNPKMSQKPGPATPLTVTQRGGTVRIGDLTYTQTHGALVLLEPNTECLLMLKKVDGRYHIAGNYYGAFDLRGGRMAPLTRKAGFANELRDRPVADGVAAIVEGLRRAR